MRISINTQDVIRRLDVLRKDEPIRKRIVGDVTMATKQELQKNLRPQSTTGLLFNSIYIKSDDKTGHVLSDRDYAEIASKTGRAPGRRPPIAALQRWARLKLGDKNLAWAVAKSIEKRGTRLYRNNGRGNAVDKTMNIMRRNIDTILQKVIKYYD